MKTITMVFTIIMVVSLINIIDANQRKRYSNDLFRERVLDLLLEAKRRGLLDNKSEQSNEDMQRRRADRFDDEDNHERTYVRRKVVGLGDNPF